MYIILFSKTFNFFSTITKKTAMRKAALVISAWLHGGAAATIATDGRGTPRRSTGLRGGNRAVAPPSDGRNLQVLVGEVSNVVDFDQTVVSAGGLLSNYEYSHDVFPHQSRKFIAFALDTILSHPEQ